MDNSPITLNSIFGLNGGLNEDQSSTLESSPGLAALKEHIKKEMSMIKWPTALEKILEGLEDLLGVDLAEIMIQAWKKTGALLDHAEKSKKNPDETFLVPLAEHTIESSHKPFIEVRLNDKPVGKVNFEIGIEFEVKGMILKIRDGKIREMVTGSCQGKGNIKCEGHQIVEKELKPITLPGAIKFTEGVAIA